MKPAKIIKFPTSKPGRNPPRRRRNSDVRPREHLTPDEIDRMIVAARKAGRHGKRDAAAILVAYRHGLRASELVSLEWPQIDLRAGLLTTRRRKRGRPSTHPIHGPTLRALRELKRMFPGSRYVFMNERGAPLSDWSFRRLVARAGRDAELPFSVHPHMLRHATGYKLANDGNDARVIQHYLGHRNIQSTVRYTEIAPGRFNGLWDD